LAVLHRRVGAHIADLPLNVAILLTTASLFTLSFLTSEIDAFWAARGAAHIWSMAREGLQAITWAAVASALVWLGITRKRVWIRAIGAALLGGAILRLLRLDLADASATYLVIANPRLIASLFVIACLYGLAYLYGQRHDAVDAVLRPRTMLLVAANALTLALFTSEITAFWHVRDLQTGRGTFGVEGHFAREMMLSVTWAAYATALIVAGLRKRYAPIRYFAIGLFVVTIVKVFSVDLAELDQIYRVASIIGLGITLLMTSYLYHRFRGRIAERNP
jgi:uncharacterized membrane protein